MIGWLHSVDVGLYRWINLSWSNPFFDWLMPFVSNSPWFACILFGIALVMMIRGGARGRCCALMMLLALCIGNWLVCDSLKHGFARLRPFHTVPGAHLRIGMGDSYSMPSSHAANWFSSTFILFLYYRRSIYAMLPLAVTVALSRIYNGVHYPTDILAGTVVGMGYSAAVMWGAQTLWATAGAKWFPIWFWQMPSLLNPSVRPEPPDADRAVKSAQWLRLSYVLIATLCAARLCYLAFSGIELSEDEAYQWLWSKHPALSYYSKPPMIAYAQWIGTRLWGDNEFGVRFLSPLIAASLSIMVLRMMAKEISGRVAFVVFVVMSVTPLLALGATVMTVDPLSVLFWTSAMVAGWRASQPNGTTGQWLWVGFWTGLGCLSKWTNLLQPVCWLIFFALWPAARMHLRKPGPYLALLIMGICCLPPLMWMQQHNWITVEHIATDGQLDKSWTKTFVFQFLGEQAGVLHPFFLVAAIWAAIAFWKSGRRDPLQLFFFSMGVPLYAGCFLLSLHSHVQPNWIAPAVIPMFCLMAVYWARRWPQWGGAAQPFLTSGIALGVVFVVFLHSPNLVNKLLHRKLPPKLDLLHRVHGWKEMARLVGKERAKLAEGGTPPFVIGEHYGFTSQLSFYMPDAKSEVTGTPVVYFMATSHPRNQFYFWPNYLERKGQNAIFIREIDRPQLRKDWLSRWWKQEPDIYLPDHPQGLPAPPDIQRQFDSVTNLGVHDVVFDGAILRRFQVIECLHLK